MSVSSFKCLKQQAQRGFTLIELLIVVTLVVITVGLSSDIIISLVRSYSKTRVTNEIEQNSNFVLLKLEKELRDASNVVVAGDGRSITFDRELGGTDVQLEYEVTAGGDLVRSVDGGSPVPMINNDPVEGIEVSLADGQRNFTDISQTSDGSIVNMHFVFEQRGSAAAKSFTGIVPLDNTIVIRGAY